MPNPDGSLTFEELRELFGGSVGALGGGVMQGIAPAVKQTVPQGVMGTSTDDLSPVNMTSMVKTNNASGTNPLMMLSGAETAGTAVASGLNNVFPTIQNLGIGANSVGGDVMPQMNASQELLDSMTPDEANVYNQLEDFQRPAFLEGLRQNKISQYEAENFNRLTRPY
tara:strand:+ start:653 stop:1156 length:504 start_codon:yes stop_codon:yes gene_type:complete